MVYTIKTLSRSLCASPPPQYAAIGAEDGAEGLERNAKQARGAQKSGGREKDESYVTHAGGRDRETGRGREEAGAGDQKGESCSKPAYYSITLAYMTQLQR